MAFLKTNYANTGGEIVYMESGNHLTKISLKVDKQVKKEKLKSGEIMQVEYEHIGITLRNEKNEIAFDKIWQNINEAEDGLEYNEWKLNQYSQAVGIPEGTEINTMQEWFNFINGKQVIAVVEDNEYTNNKGELIKNNKVKYVKAAEGTVEMGLPF